MTPSIPQDELRAILGLVERGELSPKTAFALLNKAALPAVDDIAVTGLSVRAPDANDADTLWNNLRAGRVSFRNMRREDWAVPGHPCPVADGSAADFPLNGAFLADIDKFDPLFFRIPPTQAEWMDPRQRLFLEESYKALEDAGYPEPKLKGARCGVFVGCEGGGDYYAAQFGNTRLLSDYFLGSSNSILASRIAYFADLKGPTVTVDTGCSSSLVALHLACESLRTGSADLAVTGGIQLITSTRFFELLSKLGVLSPSGRCRPFDAAADGFVPAEAVGVLVLKRLSQALADGDRIHGVIKGSGTNQDGRSNSITAPNPHAQRDLQSDVYRRFGIDPKSIGLVEAHGTGTQLGDPIEFEGLTGSFNGAAEPASCALGSIKANIGHAGAASGVLGVIKALLALRYQEIPPLVSFERANPEVGLEGSPFYVSAEVVPWKAKPGSPRRAAVSSFGHSGTNAHVVLEQAPAQPARSPRPQEPRLIVVSGKTEAALRRNIENLCRCAGELGADGADLADLSFTLLARRTHMKFRAAFVVDGWQALTAALAAYPALHNPGSGLLHDLAAKFLAGGDIEAAECLPDAPYEKLTLPSYSFERERHWLKAESTSFAPQLAHRSVVLEKHWRPIDVAPSNARPGTALVLVTSANQHLASGVVAANHTTFLLRDASEFRVVGHDEYELDFSRPEHGQRLLQALAPRLTEIDAWIDLSDLEERDTLAATTRLAKLVLLQGVLREKSRQGFTALHFTSGLQPFRSPQIHLGGAPLASLFRSLGAEYRKVNARTVDLDESARDAATIAACFAALGAAGGRESELCLRDGRYYAPHWIESTSRFGAALPASPEEVVLISGGTGGIGNALASHLFAQGVRRFAILGERPLPPQAEWPFRLRDPQLDASLRTRLQPLQTLRDKGATLHVFTGPLSDAEGLRTFLADVLRTSGRVRRVVHAAGKAIAETPAFMNKSLPTIGQVLEPKLNGLDTLWRELRAHEPVSLLLCSSISAAVPALAVGQLDYAMANGTLDFFAEYVARTSRTQVRSLCWPLWEGVGLGQGQVAPQLTSLGIKPLQTSQALALFDRCMSPELAPVLLPCVVDANAFSADALLDGPRLPPRVAAATSAAPPLLDQLRRFFARELKITSERLTDDAHFSEYGVDSIVLAELIGKLERELGQRLNPSLILEYPSLQQLAGHLATLGVRVAEPAVEPGRPQHAAPATSRARIAVIGIACRFPEADDKQRFWDNLRSARDSIREVPATRWDAKRLYSPEPGYGRSIGKWGGYVEGIELFDPKYFGIREELAAQVDPAMRWFLEECVQVVRDAGYEGSELSERRVGVFVGSRLGSYSARVEKVLPDSILGSGQNFVAAHVSHFMNLKGPALVVDTACSSSLVSVHLACQSLLLGECEMALVGGVDVLLDEKMHLGLSEAKALSPDGRCHTFGEQANGFVPGEGCGVVLLKPLDAALRDGDRIYAVVEGSAINNDGRTMGVTTPNPLMQRAVIEAALQRAELRPSALSYVEAHGTGTLIGDPIELRALSHVFAEDTSERQFCAIGSVKTNIGHLLSAAGIASFIKVCLCLEHAELVPTLHAERPNPRFRFEESPFYPAREAAPFPARGGRRVAGISSFGFGGTNAHVVLANLVEPHTSKRVALPRVVFDRKRYWLDPRVSAHVERRPAPPAPARMLQFR